MSALHSLLNGNLYWNLDVSSEGKTLSTKYSSQTRSLPGDFEGEQTRSIQNTVTDLKQAEMHLQ